MPQLRRPHCDSDSEHADSQTEKEMSKLSPTLKALVNAPFSRPGPSPAPARIRAVYESILTEAAEKNYGTRPWLTLSVRETF